MYIINLWLLGSVVRQNMSVWSKVFAKGFLAQNAVKPITLQNAKLSVSQTLKSGHDGPKTFDITPSRFSWHQFKDKFHFYVLLGAIPCGLIVFYCNVFIGPATLQPIPEGYTPKYWEYHQHPITRFIARYMWNDPQEDYEKQMHVLFEESEKRELRFLEEKIKKRMYEHQDYQSYYYRPITAKYIRLHKRLTDEYLDREGSLPRD